MRAAFGQRHGRRHNDGTGLMYYRARYYHAGCARFISEDPIGWASGQTNNYAYVGEIRFRMLILMDYNSTLWLPEPICLVARR